ncbi:MAG: SulP family inorganic anion transporter [Ktedonobacterales bacterium]
MTAATSPRGNAPAATNRRTVVLHEIARYIPIFGWLPSYSRRWLRGDVIAGVTLVALAVPESLGYAQIAGVPVQAGLYALFGALVGYALFGSSRQLVVGPSSALAAVSAATIATLAPGGSDRFLALTAGLAFAAALVALVAGLARLGFIAQFLAEPVLTGFIFGLSMTIAIRQAPKLFGITGGEGNFFQRLWDLLTHLGQTNGWTLAVGVASLAILFGSKRLVPSIPASLAALVFGILVVSFFGLDHYGVAIVGAVPAGLPPIGLPALHLSDIGTLLSAALGLTLIAYAEHIGAASSFAARHHQDIDPNQEFIGLGAANLAAGVCQGFAVGGSLSKTAANDAAGGRTQIAGLAAAVLVLLTMLVLTPLFHNLPEATLGAVVIFAVWGLMDVGALRRYWRLRRLDLVLALTALAGELVFDVLPGLLLAVALSLILLIYRASQPHLAVLGKVPGQHAYASVEQHPEYVTVPGLLIVRVDAPLFFANDTTARAGIRALIREASPPLRAVLLDLETSSTLDTSSADMLAELADELKTMGIALALARVRTPVRTMLELTGLTDTLGKNRIHASIEAGVETFRA